MSYWSQNSAQSSQLDDLLSKEDVSLREVMDEAEVLQECKTQNKKLIDYLARLDVLRELIALTTKEPADDSAEAVRYKYPSIACELLTSELPQIIQTLASEEFLLAELYAFLEADPPLNPLLASFFSRIMGVLISKTSEQNWFSYQVTCLQVLEFLKSKGNCIGLLLRHIGTSAIMDLILKMYTKIEGPEIRDNFLTWLDEGEFLEQLVAQLNPETLPEVRSNVCQLLCDLVLSSRENVNKSTEKPEQDKIARKIESEEFVKRLLDQMLMEPRCEGSIVGGISVLLTLLGKRDENPCASWDVSPSLEGSTVTENTVAAITPHLTHVLDILRNPPQKSAVRTTVGILDPPLGATRVEVVRLLAALVATGHENLLAELQRQDLLNVLLELFFQYPWNNFLHAQVEATFVAAFKSTALFTHILSRCHLLQRILQAWQDNDAQEKEKKPRRGYMGHLIRISNRIVEETKKPPLDAILINVETDVLTQWQEFVDSALAKVIGDQSSGMGFQQKRQEESENEEFYQEALAPSFTDNFCAEPPGNNDDTGNSVGERTLKPGFPGADSESAMDEQAQLFSQVCSQKMQSLDDDAEMWSSIMRNTSEEREARAWNDDGSSDEEPGGGADDDPDDWADAGSSVVVVEQNNPWSADVLSASSPPDQGWANFEASPFLANFGFDLSSTIATSAPGDVERVPFDLTPTENQTFPPNDSDWPNMGAPTDWPITPPSETPPSDVETPPADKEEAPPPLPGVPPPDEGKPLTNNTSSSLPSPDVASSTEFGSFIGADPTANDAPPTADEAPPTDSEASPIGSSAWEDTTLKKVSLDSPSHTMDASALRTPHEEEMETAQVIESESSAQIVAVSDIMSQYEELKLGAPSSSCLSTDTLSLNSSVDSVVAAFPSETVIKQTETLDTPEDAALPSNIPSASDAADVATQLAELLAEVSVSSDSGNAVVNASESRTLSETGIITNGPGATGDAASTPSQELTVLPPCIQTHNNSRNESPNKLSITDNDELVALQENTVPKVSSKIAVKEEEVANSATAPNDPVTAI